MIAYSAAVVKPDAFPADFKAPALAIQPSVRYNG